MGYRVFNKETQQYQGATAQELPNLLQSGKFSLDAGDTYKAAVPGGDYFDINPNTDFSTAIQDGLTFEDDNERNKRIRLEKAAEFPGLAAGTAALRGASAGISDVAFRGIDESAKAFTGESPGITQFISDIKEANPTASTLGEIGGTIASLAVPVSAPSLIGKAGVATTEALATRLGVKLGEKPAADIIRRAAAKGLGSAVEGALYGASQSVSEAALGNPEDAAQNLIANVGVGAIFGGLSGAVPSFLGDVYRGKVAGLTRKAASEAMEAVDDFNNATKGGLLKDSVDLITTNYLKEGPNKEARQLALNFVENPNQMVRTMTDTIQGAFKATKDFSYAVTKDAKNDLIEKFGQTKGKEAKKAAFLAIDSLKNTRDSVKTFLASPEASLVDKGVLKNIQIISEKHKKILSEIYRKGDERTVGESFKALDEFRKDFDRIAKPYLGKKEKTLMTPREEATRDVIQRFRSISAEALVDEKVFGVLGSTNKKVNAAVTNFIDLSKEIGKAFGEKNPITKKRVISPGKIKSLMNNPADARNALKQDLFTAWSEAAQNVIKVSKETGVDQFLKDMPEDTLRILQDTNAMKKSTEQMRASLIALNALQPTTGAKLSGAIIGNSIGAVIGGIVGTLVGGPIAGVIGGAVGTGVGHLISSPVTRWRILSKMERAVLSNQNETAEKINRFFGGLPIDKKIKASGTRAGALDTFSQMLNDYQDDNSDKKRKARAKEDIRKTSIPNMMTQLQNVNPDLFLQGMQKKLEGFEDAAPQVASQLAAANVRGMMFLKSKLPQNTLAGSDIFPDSVKIMPSDSEQASFKRYVESVMDPMDTLNKFVEGRLQREHVEALQAVYPQLYGQIQSQVVDAMTNSEKPISYEKKLRVATLLNIPTMAAMTPDFMQALQASYALPNGEPNGRMGAKPIQMNTAVNGMTATQQAMT